VSVLAGSLTGCGEDAPQAKAPPPPRDTTPPPPPAPKVLTLESLMAEMGIDERVRLNKNKLPASTEDRRAVLAFFDCFARTDDVALARMMPLIDQIELTALVDSGVWKETCAGLTAIDVQCGTGPFEEKCALAVFQVHGTYQAQLWYYQGSVDGYIFDAAPTPPGIMGKLHGDDWIQVWHDILDEEREIALQPDIDFNIEPEILDEGDDGPDDSGGGPSVSPGPASAPSPGGGAPTRRPPPRKPRRAPGPG